jgi:hypothetical protein
MKFQIASYVIIATFSFGLSSLSFSEEKIENEKACEEYTTKLAQTIIDARRKGTLNIVKQDLEVIGSTEVSQMVVNRMLYMAEKIQSLTTAELRSDGYSYCIGLLK